MTSVRASEPGGPRAPRLSAILFDVDGVLVESLQVIERAWRRWAREHQLPEQDVLAVVHGRPAREVIGLVAPAMDAPREVLRLAEYEAESGEVSVMPGARECVAFASLRRWAVVTSGSRTSATARLAAVGLPVPEVMVTADDVARGKPSPEPYLRAAAALGVPAAGCVAIEDAPAGVLAARQAGMTVLAVTTTHPAAALGHADQVLAGMGEVAGWLRGHPAREGRPGRSG